MVKDILNPFFLRFFLFRKLPLAFIAGLKVDKLEDYTCVTVLRYKWLTKNPFRSMYFAAQSMAAEFSTALLAVQAIENSGKNMAMLIVSLRAEFGKKATGRVTFTCNDGKQFTDGIKSAIVSGQPVTIEGKSEGRDESGELVSVFYFNWSFKERKQN